MIITGVTISNFKKIDKITFPLSQSVVIIGPNNAGKSTVMQALCLWEIGIKTFIAAKGKHDLNRNGAVSINRKDLVNSPISDARFLWRDKKVTTKTSTGKVDHTKLEVSVTGEKPDGKDWKATCEFTFSNTESIGCRMIEGAEAMKELYRKDMGVHFGFLQPMSGIATEEDKLTQGAIDRRLGEGRTAEVLRNLCYQLLHPETDKKTVLKPQECWIKLKQIIKSMFGAELLEPEFIKTTGIIQLEYRHNNIRYDISLAGRGFQQTLLLMAYLYTNPNTVVLLDEPDAHLEVIRQREVFQMINEIAASMGSQLIIASHSEVVLQEAGEGSNIIALIENTALPLNRNDNPQAYKSLKQSLTEIGWEKYYLARYKGHVLYLEGSTDHEMLVAFADRMKHPVTQHLRQANLDYTGDNVPNTAVKNYVALQSFFPKLKGLALFDSLPKKPDNPKLKILTWERRELENYFARPAVLIKHAKLMAHKYSSFPAGKLAGIMEDTISDFTPRAYLNNLTDDWWNTEKLSDDWLDKIFSQFYKKLGIPQDFFKRDYYLLIHLLSPEEIAPEIKEKLDAIQKVIVP